MLYTLVVRRFDLRLMMVPASQVDEYGKADVLNSFMEGYNVVHADGPFCPIYFR